MYIISIVWEIDVYISNIHLKLPYQQQKTQEHQTNPIQVIHPFV